MPFRKFSRRQLGRIAGWSALGMPVLSAGSGLAQSNTGTETRYRPPPSGFPNGFLWGTATSAYQIEGAVNEDGRGPSIWDRFAHTRGTIADNSNGDTATDHYHLYKEDIQLMKALGTKAYRFSIAWPRVFPDGAGAPNPKGLDFYHRLVDELLANGIAPFATLYHWDLPQALQDRFGGWTSRDTAKAFADYAGHVAARLSDRVTHFFTINECSRLVHLGHGVGADAPGLKLSATRIEAGPSSRRAGPWPFGPGDPGPRSRRNPGRPGGKCRELHPRHRNASQHPRRRDGDARAQRRLSDRHDGGKIHRCLPGAGRQRRAEIHAEDLRIISSPVDFVGLNVYTPDHYVVAADNARGFTLAPFPASFPHMKAGWLRPGPEAMYWVPRHVAKLWNVKSIYITENGTSGSDQPAGDGTIYDVDRIMYLRNYLTQLQRATSEGVPVLGYFLWSLMDNFEWSDGYEQRFGLYHVDFETRRRTPKLSASFYRETIARNAVA